MIYKNNIWKCKNIKKVEILLLLNYCFSTYQWYMDLPLSPSMLGYCSFYHVYNIVDILQD